jgi:uncharacterized membrane protein YeaQ/YmgE (transglycosylase-associated protein family)
MKNFARLAPILLCLLLGACSDSATSVVCPGDLGPAVVVNVVDGLSGASVTQQASGTWTSGTRSDSLRHVVQADSTVVLAAYGPPGIYQVRVVRAGHVDWVSGDVMVPEGRCGPARSNVTATLTVISPAVIH